MTSEMEEGRVELTHCPTQDMVADLFTKALPRVSFEKLRKEFMTCHTSVVSTAI